MASPAQPGEDATTKMLLKQASSTLENAELVREQVLKVFRNRHGDESDHETPAMLRLREADTFYRHRLIVALSLARMCKAPGYQEKHRLQRLGKMLQACDETAAAMRAAYDEVTQPTINGEVLSKGRHLKVSADMIAISATSLKVDLAGSNRLGKLSSENPVEGTVSTVAGHPSRLISGNAYFDRSPHTSRYEWKTSKSRLHKGIGEKDLPNVVVDIMDSAAGFESRKVSDKPLWWPTLPASETARSAKVGGINAVWLSPMTNTLFDKSDRSAYKVLFDAITAAGASTSPSSTSHRAFVNPTELAQGLKALQIDLGVMLSEDRRSIVWPLGKEDASQGRCVLVECCAAYGAGWRYKTIIPPYVHKTSPQPREVPDSQDSTDRITSSRDTDSSSPTESHSPFLRLPPELRNMVYTEYLAEPTHITNSSPLWTHEHVKIGYLDKPDICMTCRTLRDEVLPVYLASRKVHVKVQGGAELSTWSYLARYVFTQANRWMSFVPISAQLTHVVFVFKVARVEVVLRKESPGFELTAMNLCKEPKVGRYLGLLRELVQIIVEDKTTPGLSVVDVALIADFLYARRKL